jgi:hypothetical protein
MVMGRNEWVLAAANVRELPANFDFSRHGRAFWNCARDIG